MHPKPAPLSPSLLLLALCLLPQATPSEYDDCIEPLPLPCGSVSLNISYPFTASGRPAHCGYPNHSVSCSGANKLIITIGDRIYQVKRIDYASEVIALAEVYSAEGDSCPRQLNSTVLDDLLFSYTEEDVKVSLFNCTNPPAVASVSLYNLTCQATGKSAGGWYYGVDLTYEEDAWLRRSCGPFTVLELRRDAADKLKGHSNATVFWEALEEGFYAKWKTGNEWCGECLSTGGVCGYNASAPLQRTCFCREGLRVGSCRSRGHKQNLTMKVLIAGSVFGAGFLATLLVVLYFRPTCSKKNGSDIRAMEDMLAAHGPLGISRCSYGQLRRMTDHFSTKLGSGGCGSVYKGQLDRNGKLIPVAVKLLHKQEDSSGSGLDFFNEVASIGSTNHVNVVSLLAFCLEGPHRALVYEFMPNGSLDRFIFQSTAPPLGWARLHSIALGIARGLLYLHRGCRNRIVHFDIKPHNILLDENFCPKISDFGLAKLCRPSMGSALSMHCARGTVGYIAPEVFSRSFGVVSSKSDVYSYGMMVLEMVCGRRNFDDRVERSGEVYFPRWAYERLVGDEDLAGACGVADEEDRRVVRKMVIVGLWCIQTSPCNRPSIGRVVEMLEGGVGDLEIPPKPYMCSPIREQSRRGTGVGNHSPDSSMNSESSGILHQGCSRILYGCKATVDSAVHTWMNAM